MKTTQYAIVLSLVVLFLAVAPIASATEISFTSTANFDAGTKSESGNGNYAIETLTDNLGIATGAFELGSLKGDTFSHSDADGNTSKWTTTLGGSGSGSGCNFFMESGVAKIEGNSNTAVRDCALIGTASVSGSFDVRSKFDFTAGSVKVYELCAVDVSQCRRITGYSGTADGIFYDNLVGTLQGYKVVSGTATALGTGTAVANNPLWLRISRSGDDFSFYYSTDGSSWTFDETVTVTGIPTSLVPGMNTARNGAAYGIVKYALDDFHVASGTVDAGGFRTSGQWTSAAQSSTTEAFENVNVTYSGASADSYITAVSLLDGGGSTVWVDDSDRTSGTSFSYDVDTLVVSGMWNVRVNLTGDGASTVTVESVVVHTEPPVQPSISNPIVADTTVCFAPYVQDFNANVGTWTLATNGPLFVGSANGTVYGNMGAPTSYYVNVTVTNGPLSDYDNYTLTVYCFNVVVTVEATSVGASFGTMHGNLTFIGDQDGAAFVTFEWGTGPSLGRSTDVGWLTSEDEFSLLFYDLSPGTTYFFRATADGNNTAKATGAVLSFTTTGPRDYTIFWILLIVTLALAVLALLLERLLFIFAGVTCVLLGVETLVNLAQPGLAIVFMGLAVFLSLIGFFGRD